MSIVPPSTIISHWYRPIEGLQTSPLDFYGSVEEVLKRREVPDANPSRLDWREGGMFSARREYLRVTRGRHSFDICAAPFGNGFFVSWWLGEPRPSPVLATLAFAVIFYLVWLLARGSAELAMHSFYYLGLGMVWSFLTHFQVFGLMTTIFLLFVGFVLIGAFFRESPLDAYILAIPVIGWVFERTFRPLTYYRIDTALMFQSAVHAAVLEVVDDLTKAKGLRSLSELERKPVLREFYNR